MPDYLKTCRFVKYFISMTGLNYIINDKGERIAVLIDLKKNGRLREDFYDAMIADGKRDEPRIPWNDAKKLLKKAK